ncbi:MAG: hypothetical protein GY861_03805 [bacterium]|nr:hypothetical protein [bacterium]
MSHLSDLETLKECKWTHPSDYGGHSPDGDYCVYSRNRGSSILENCNYDIILEELSILDKKVYDFRAGHWACGWIEYIIVPANSNKKTLERAEEILRSLADYPVLDDSKCSEMEIEARNEYWSSLDISERIELINEANGNIFAARHDYITENADPQGFMLEEIC